jgi:hypothetical protein
MCIKFKKIFFKFIPKLKLKQAQNTQKVKPSKSKKKSRYYLKEQLT